MPIELAVQGDENALGFSLNFDPAILSNPQAVKGSSASAATLNTNAGQAAQGRFGVALALPSGQTFAAGSRQIVVVSFNIAASTTAISTVIDFGDAPIRRQISNAGALSLPANYLGCTSIGLFRGYEADVTPRPSGKNDGTVSITDWVLIGRFVGGLDTPAAGEFQRADCSPRETKGDGQLSVTDWVQAGRYAAGLDAVQTVGGPTAPASLTASIHEVLASRAKAIPRTMRLPSAVFQRGRINVLTVELEARGDENAIGFSLQYDPSLLRFAGANLGDGLGNALLNVNSTQTAAGRVGMVLALPAGERFAAGAHAFVTVRFDALAGASSAMTNVEFADQPVRRQTSDANANALTANYSGGIVNVNQSPRRRERQSSN